MPKLKVTGHTMSIETRFDIPFVADLALREKQIQQNYRPIIAVHKWFARRPGSLFRSLLLAEFVDEPLSASYFRGHDLEGVAIADPFMGGGTPLIEANRLGCEITGFDINPMSAWIVREEIEHLDLSDYRTETSRLLTKLRTELAALYQTDCPHYGDADVPVKYFLWVKQIDCESCGDEIDLFPGYVVSEDSRHPKNVLVCPECGELNEVADRKAPGKCTACKTALRADGPAARGKCACKSCGTENRYPRAGDGPLKHRLFAIEYYNPARKAEHKGRFFKKPDAKDLDKVAAASQRWARTKHSFVPDQEILPGDETDRLHRWGYNRYREMFNERQLLGLELSCRLIARVKDERVRHAMATNLSDLLRYQNMLCRYDTWALKSLDIFSVHGFPVGLVQCESNLLGITNGNDTNVGSGGWTNIIEKYAKAKRYCDEPFEVQKNGARSVQIPIEGEWIGETKPGRRTRSVNIHCQDSVLVQIEPRSLDAVFTDPPYFGNVQYGELMDFCYVWLRRLAGDQAEGFHHLSTRADEELTGNATKSRGLEHFTEGLARVYSRMAESLKPGAPLAFTYHHNKLEAYRPVGVAILDSGLTCSASLPCPAEMSGSIHIHGTASSILDTVFVCRDSGNTPKHWLFKTTDELAQIIAADAGMIALSGRKPTKGDLRCMTFGHLTRMAIWNLRPHWQSERPTAEKLTLFANALAALPDTDAVIGILPEIKNEPLSPGPLFETAPPKRLVRDAVAF